ncbi:hypothetical protein OAH18_03125, partial [bacterium]|nr:hypothetical protein [bacterium]
MDSISPEDERLASAFDQYLQTGDKTDLDFNSGSDEQGMTKLLAAIDQLQAAGLRDSVSAPTTEPSKAGDQIGRFQVIDCLGIGGQSAVFRAHDPMLMRDVAIKLYYNVESSESMTAILEEGRRLVQVNSNRVANVLSVDCCDGLPYLVLELIDGAALDQYAAQLNESPSTRDRNH